MSVIVCSYIYWHFFINSVLFFHRFCCNVSFWISFEFDKRATEEKKKEREFQTPRQRQYFCLNSDRLESFTSLPTFRSHGWNTEYVYQHCLPPLGAGVCECTSNPKDWRVAAACVFLLPRRYGNWDRGFCRSSLHNVNRQLGICRIPPAR